VQVLQKGQYSGTVTEIASETGLTASVTAYHPDDFNGAWHYHDNAHISFVLQGACVEKKQTSYDRTPGKITYYSAREPHQVTRILKPSRHINLEIEESFSKVHFITDDALRTAIATRPDAKFLMVRMYKELLENDEFSAVSIQMLLLHLIEQTGQLPEEARLPGWVRTVRALLHERPDEQVTLKELSAAAGVHPITISKYFPAYFACTLGDYMRKLKVEKALHLIKTADCSLTSVAYACGFSDQSHFIRTFKQYTGFLPAAYQRS
jgi:AraC-like DNA-binding protein